MSDWKEVRLKYVCSSGGQYGANIPATEYKNEGVRFLRTTDILESGAITDESEGVFVVPEAVAEFILEDGDLLFSRSGTLGRAYIHRIQVAGTCAFAGYLVRFKPRPEVNPKFLFYVGNSAKFLKQVEAEAVESTISNFNAEKYGNVRFLLPPFAEQQAIADMLDRETARLDTLLKEKERLLALLAEKRRALITRAVTRGLDPHAPTHDSGLPWLGEIPAHWPVLRAKYLFKQSALPVSEDDEMVTCFRDGQVTLRKNRREEGFTNANLELGYQGIRAGQLVLHSMDAFAGAIGVSDSDGKCSPEYIICDPTDGRVDNYFFGHLLRTMALNGFIQASCPAVRERAPRIRFNDFGEMFFPVPPLEEQRDIVAHIETETRKLDALRAEASRTIALLKERRAALIAAAVTGQLAAGVET